MDTFKYFKVDKGILTNNVESIEKPYLELESTLGQALRRFEDEPSRTVDDM